MKNYIEKIELKELLKTLKKDELMEFTKIYPIKGKSKMKKEGLITALYEKMIAEETIKENSIIIGELLKEIDQETDKTNGDFVKIRNLCSLGYGKITRLDEDIKFIIADEVEHFTINEDIKEEILRYSLIKSYILACVRLYGVCELDFLINLFNEQNPAEKPLDYKELDLQIERCEKRGIEPVRYGNCVVSESLLMIEGDLEELFEQRANKGFYKPTKEELLKFEDDFYVVKTRQYMELKKFLRKMVKNKDMADGLIEDLAFIPKLNDITIDDGLNEFRRRNIEFTSVKEVQSFIKLYADLLNNTRCWANRGYTPKEFLKNEQLNSLNKVEIGRNEQCPCGSGKKYKKCCLNK